MNNHATRVGQTAGAGSSRNASCGNTRAAPEEGVDDLIVVGDVAGIPRTPPLPGADGAFVAGSAETVQREETSTRVLVASVPAAGHFRPLVPLALALRDAGEEVMVASAASVCERARSIGLAAAPVGTEVEQWFEALRSRGRGIPGDGLPPERILGYFCPRLFGERGAPAMADG